MHCWKEQFIDNDVLTCHGGAGESVLSSEDIIEIPEERRRGGETEDHTQREYQYQ